MIYRFSDLLTEVRYRATSVATNGQFNPFMPKTFPALSPIKVCIGSHPQVLHDYDNDSTKLRLIPRFVGRQGLLPTKGERSSLSLIMKTGTIKSPEVNCPKDGAPEVCEK